MFWRKKDPVREAWLRYINASHLTDEAAWAAFAKFKARELYTFDPVRK